VAWNTRIDVVVQHAEWVQALGAESSYPKEMTVCLFKRLMNSIIIYIIRYRYIFKKGIIVLLIIIYNLIVNCIIINYILKKGMYCKTLKCVGKSS